VGPFLEDVRVVMHVEHVNAGSGPPRSPCAGDRWIPREADRPPHHPWPVTSEGQIYEEAYTDDEGRFAVQSIFPGFIGMDVYLVLCFLSPDREPYAYVSPYPDPSLEKLLHVVLRPKAGAK
jgi:hypothetical protein